jgi:hypothetical protein
MKTTDRMPHARLAPLALLFLAACASTPPGAVAGGTVWLEPSPNLAEEIEDRVRVLPWTHGEDRVEMIRWFAAVGEPAYARLLVLCLDARPDVSATAVAALGASGDSRLVEPINALDWPASPHPQVRFERARALLRLGDWSELEALIDGLEAESLWTRAWCARALEEVTRQRFDFDPRGDEAERAAAVGRWRDWVRQREAEGILVTKS